jgi:hypothetical protein
VAGFGADSVHDPGCFFFGDLGEVEHCVTALGRAKERRELPGQITREGLIDLPVVFLHASEHASWPFAAAELVDDGVISDLVCHRSTPGSL